MKSASKPFAIKMVFGVFFLFIFTFSVFGSSIQGFVYDKQRNPVSDIDVELLDENYRSFRRTRSDGVGRYNFDGLNDGRYTVRVMAFRYDFEDQELPVEVYTQSIKSSSSGGTGLTQGNGTFIQDFYLLPKKGGLRDMELGVVFAQEVPKEAQTLYEKAVKDFADKKTDVAIKGLLGAIKIFPDYYSALYRLGVELYIRNQYSDAVKVFLKASEINQKSAISYYYLALSLHKLGKDYNKAALVSINKAVGLAPASAQMFLLLGKIERSMGSFPDAEKHLLQAKKLALSKNPDIHMELAELYSNELKKYKEAADELELYLKSFKPTDEEEKKWKQIIVGLREKAKTQTS